jgi:hypothetical protein
MASCDGAGAGGAGACGAGACGAGRDAVTAGGGGGAAADDAGGAATWARASWVKGRGGVRKKGGAGRGKRGPASGGVGIAAPLTTSPLCMRCSCSNSCCLVSAPDFSCATRADICCAFVTCVLIFITGQAFGSDTPADRAVRVRVGSGTAQRAVWLFARLVHAHFPNSARWNGVYPAFYAHLCVNAAMCGPSIQLHLQSLCARGVSGREHAPPHPTELRSERKGREASGLQP